MKIHVEFCIKWHYDPEFERVSNIVKSFKPDAEISSNEIPPRSGAFEVKIDDELIFSKFQSERFPTTDEIKAVWNTDKLGDK